MSIALGIDLGTTNTVMAVVQGSVKQLQNRQNENLTRSAVGFHNGQFIVGSNAMDRMAQDPTNLILSVKRLMGRSFLDEEIQKIKEKYLYKIQAPENGTTEDIRVVLAGKEYSPIEISAKILKKIKDDAEYRLNDKVEFATITVPAYFGDKQVEATRLAGLLAGFKVQMILDEPTAAAIAFSVDQVKEDEARNILIYDLGGGTFDVSVLTVAGGVCARLNTEGNMWLGGDDFDHKIMDFILEKIKKDSGIDGTKDKLFMLELKKKAENAKIQLSGMSEVNVYIPSSLKDSKGNFVLVDYDINTAQFERMIEPQVTESIRIVKKAMERAGLTDDQIDNVLLVGGSSTIPLVQRALEDTFGAQKILKNVDAMLCVAYGAAIIANRFGENVKCLECETMNDGNNMNCTTCGKSLCIERQNIIETTLGTNKPYGIQTVGDKFVEIIPKNTPYPMQEHMVKMFEVPSPNLRRLRVPVYAGENEIATQNDYQFTVWLPLPQGTSEGTKLEVGFLVDGNGTFSSVKLKLKDGSGIEKQVFVNRDLGLDGKAERGKVENKINELKVMLDQNHEKLGSGLYDEFDTAYQDVIDAIEKNEIEESEKKARELEESLNKKLKSNEPEWMARSLNLIAWVELALTRFGADFMDPDVSYKIKSDVENLKKAVEDNNEKLATEKYALLDEKTSREQIPLVYHLTNLTINSFTAANKGLTNFSDKLNNIIVEIGKAYKAGELERMVQLVEEGYMIVSEITKGVPGGDSKKIDIPKEVMYFKSSN